MSPAHKIRKVFERYLFLRNYDNVDVVAATWLANKLKGARLWLCLIGPSGCGKTTLAESLLGLPRVQPLDGITQGTFSSGYRLKDSPQRFGMFERLSDGKEHFLVIPDFSTILGNTDLRKAMLPQLRRIYDGKWDQEYGTGVQVRWQGKIGLIACATPNYEHEIASEAVFGERFIYWRIPLVDKLAITERAMRNATQTEEIRAALQKAMEELKKVKIPKEELKLSLSIRNAIAKEVAFAATARTPVKRDRYTKEISDTPTEESPSRFSQQISQLLRGLMLYAGVKQPRESELETVETCTFMTIPMNRLKVMAVIGDEELRLDKIHRLTRIPRSTCKRTCEDLYEIGILARARGSYGDSREVYWRCDDEFVGMFKRCRRVAERTGIIKERKG